MKNTTITILFGGFALILVSCDQKPPVAVAAAEAQVEAPALEQDVSIYSRLGGEAAINAAVDLFYEKVLADNRVNHFFEDINMSAQIRKQKEFFTTALGGPAVYQGKDLRRAHKNLSLIEDDFTVISDHLQASLEELGVDENLVGEVMAIVASVKDDVLNRPAH